MRPDLAYPDPHMSNANVVLSTLGLTKQFGSLTAFTMAVCAATDLLLLPAVLVRWRL